MTLDDDSILSAYLDGQLGPEEQQAVESALFADPRLAEEFRGLATLRDLLAGLPREAPADVTGRVMRRVRRRATRGAASRVIAWGPVRAAGLVGLAAGVLMILALPWLLHPGRPAADGRHPADVAGGAPAEAKARPILSERLWPHFSKHASRENPGEPTRPGENHPAQPVPAGSRGSAPGELVDVREYLDNPELRRVFLVSDREDGSAGQRVASLVEQTTRFNFYKITISQGIVIDPHHPDEATVFALVVGPRELEDLRRQLRAALDDRVEETDVVPAVVTQLADIGHVEACPPSPAAEMVIPRDAVALLREGDAPAPVEGAEALPPPRAEPAKAPRPPTPEQERSRPDADRAVAARTDPPIVVLVWVTRAHPG
jgi:hypothetical protein